MYTSRGVRARNDLTPPSLPVPWCPGPSAVLSKVRHPGRLPLATPCLTGVVPPRACLDVPGARLPDPHRLWTAPWLAAPAVLGGAAIPGVAWTRTTVNNLAQWGLEVDSNDRVHLSIAKFSLCHTNTSVYNKEPNLLIYLQDVRVH